jgi:DNA ligase-associated metallophosphoesterase
LKISSFEKVQCSGTELHLLPERAIYWKERNCLFIADLHFGKTNHFRKEGIAIPSQVGLDNLDRFDLLLSQTEATAIFVLGDLFHSEHNSSCDLVDKLLEKHKNKEFHLVIGNHDILDDGYYKNSGWNVHSERYKMEPFILTHEPLSQDEMTVHFNLCGHIHPGVIMSGKGRRKLRLPCFYFADQWAILPAFGTFTGIKTLKTNKRDKVFVIVGNKVLGIKPSILQT